METKFENNTIFGGVLNGAIFGDNNIIQNGNNNSLQTQNTKTDFFIEGLDEVIKHSNNKEEQKCAKKAKNLYINNKSSLREFIIDNVSTFTTGTFATVSGGLLLSAIKNILKMG